MRIRVIYYIVLSFCIAALAWWSYSLIHFCIIEYRQKTNALEQELKLGKLHIQLVSTTDTSIVKPYSVDGYFINKTQLEYFENFVKNYSNDLELKQLTPSNFILEINTTSLANLKSEKNRKVMMYVMEGLFFMAAFIWGLMWIYSRLNAIIKLNLQKSNFMMAITHELKSPLASLKLMLQTIQKRKLEEYQLQEIVSNGISDVERLSDLTENILVASQIEGGNYDYNFQLQNLSLYLEQIIEDYNLRHGNYYCFEIKIIPEIYWFYDKLAIALVFNNLLDNAMKYSPKHSVIKISTEKKFQKTNIYITDQGVGITEEESVQIFDKFYRSGNENTRKTKGTGLGLFIVKKILEDHNATIQLVKNKQQIGTTFCIQIIDGK